MFKHLVLAALFMLPFAHHAHAGEFCAAYDPNVEGTAQMSWGSSCDQAMADAVISCKGISETCASRAAATPDPEYLFVTVCCDDPKRGCQTTAALDMKTANLRLLGSLSAAGYAHCSIDSVLSAKTGTKLSIEASR